MTTLSLPGIRCADPIGRVPSSFQMRDVESAMGVRQTSRSARKGDADGMGDRVDANGIYHAAPADRRCAAAQTALAGALAMLPAILQAHAARGKRTEAVRAWLAGENGQASLRLAMAQVFDPSKGLSVPFDAVVRHFADPRNLRPDEVSDAITMVWERETGCGLPPAELPAGKVRTVRERKRGGPVSWPFSFIRRTAIALADRESRAARKRTVGIVDSLASFGSDDAYSVENVMHYLRDRIGGKTGATAARAMGVLLDGHRAMDTNERKALSNCRARIEALLSKGLDARGARVARIAIARAD
ncbi:MAG: hypothetical protein H7062_22360 [Candidatus Saccharimonas sp.]|nr:hypothetical protein [Planctomycetaceae bacterium]